MSGFAQHMKLQQPAIRYDTGWFTRDIDFLTTGTFKNFDQKTSPDHFEPI